MRVALAVVLFAILLGLSLLHFQWARGSHWPAASEEALARAAVGDGRHRMPGQIACLSVSVLLLAVGLWPLVSLGYMGEAWAQRVSVVIAGAFAAGIDGARAAGPGNAARGPVPFAFVATGMAGALVRCGPLCAAFAGPLASFSIAAIVEAKAARIDHRGDTPLPLRLEGAIGIRSSAGGQHEKGRNDRPVAPCRIR